MIGLNTGAEAHSYIMGKAINPADIVPESNGLLVALITIAVIVIVVIVALVIYVKQDKISIPCTEAWFRFEIRTEVTWRIFSCRWVNLSPGG